MHTHISWDITANCLNESLAMLHGQGYQGYWGVEHHSAQNEYSEVAIQLGVLSATPPVAGKGRPSGALLEGVLAGRLG